MDQRAAAERRTSPYIIYKVRAFLGGALKPLTMRPHGGKGTDCQKVNCPKGAREATLECARAGI